jgi:hypothetical protein
MFRRPFFTCVDHCYYFLFLESRGRIQIFDGLIASLPLYKDVKYIRGVRPGGIKRGVDNIETWLSVLSI